MSRESTAKRARRAPRLPWLVATSLLAVACGEELDYTTDDGVFVRYDYGDLRDEGRARYTTLIELHTEAIFPSCTPNGGVCHNSKEYPDLHTPGNFLTAVQSPCNVSVPDPLLVDDVCEPIGDRLRVLQNEGVLFEATVGWIQLEERDVPEGETPVSDLVMSIDRPLPFGLDEDDQLYDFQIVRELEDGEERILVDERRRLFVERSAEVVRIPGAISDRALNEDAFRTLTERVRQGDKNQNGVYGGLQARLITPGDPENSFILWRITGRSLPPMPLANEPLREAAVVALICWIEQLERAESVYPEMPIDYENCDLSQWNGTYRYSAQNYTPQ